MTKIRVGIVNEHSEVIDMNKSFEEITMRNIHDIIGEDKVIMGWAKMEEIK